TLQDRVGACERLPHRCWIFRLDDAAVSKASQRMRTHEYHNEFGAFLMYRDPRLRGLSSEHHQALVLAVTLKKAAKSGDAAMLDAAAKELAERFETELDPHFIVEEELLLPALRARGSSEYDLIERTE